LRLSGKNIRVREVFYTVLSSLGFSFLGSSDRAERVDGGDSADGAGGEAGLEDFTVRSKCKIGCVDDAAPLFPVGADFVGILWDFEAIADRKGRAGALDHFLGFVERIDGEGDNVGILCFEFLKVRLIVGDLPNTVRSPDAAVEDDDGVFAGEIVRNI